MAVPRQGRPHARLHRSRALEKQVDVPLLVRRDAGGEALPPRRDVRGQLSLVRWAELWQGDDEIDGDRRRRTAAEASALLEPAPLEAPAGRRHPTARRPLLSERPFRSSASKIAVLVAPRTA
jgi:hypothetical protein